MAIGNVEKDLDKWIACRRIDNVRNTAEGEAESDNHHESEGTVDTGGPHNSFWKDY